MNKKIASLIVLAVVILVIAFAPTGEYKFIEKKSVAPYSSEKYTVLLLPNQVIIGQAFGFQNLTGGCVAFIVRPGQFTFTVTDGSWSRYKNASGGQVEALLLGQIDSLKRNYGCILEEIRIVRLP